MLTVNQRDILAGIIANRFVDDNATYSVWIEEYETHRKRIEEQIVRAENDRQD